MFEKLRKYTSLDQVVTNDTSYGFKEWVNAKKSNNKKGDAAVNIENIIIKDLKK